MYHIWRERDSQSQRPQSNKSGTQLILTERWLNVLWLHFNNPQLCFIFFKLSLMSKILYSVNQIFMLCIKCPYYFNMSPRCSVVRSRTQTEQNWNFRSSDLHVFDRFLYGNSWFKWSAHHQRYHLTELCHLQKRLCLIWLYSLCLEWQHSPSVATSSMLTLCLSAM